MLRRPGPRGCPNGLAFWLSENAPALAQAATALRNIDMCTPAVDMGEVATGGELAGRRGEAGVENRRNACA